MSQRKKCTSDAGTSTLSSEAHPASPSALPAAVEQLVTAVICGQSLSGSYATLNRNGLWQRTQPESSPHKKSKATPVSVRKASSSARSCAILPRWGIASAGVCGVPVTWARPTKGKESSSWPTIRASDGAKGSPNQRDSSGNPGLPGAVAQWPTPRASTSTGPSHHGEGGADLQTAVLWATPNTMDHLPQRSPEAMRRQFEEVRKGRKAPCNLREQVHPECYPESLWPTPGAAACGMTAKTSGRPVEKSTKLQTQVHIAENWATPVASDHQNSRCGSGRSSRTELYEKGSVLSPEWVELLMGFPPGWTFPAGLLDEDKCNTPGSRRALSRAKA